MNKPRKVTQNFLSMKLLKLMVKVINQRVEKVLGVMYGLVFVVAFLRCSIFIFKPVYYNVVNDTRLRSVFN